MAREAGASTVFIDSLKDAIISPSDEKVAGLWNRAVQTALKQGIQVCVLHHTRKAQVGNKKPNKLDDVIGSRWLHSGMGSVICLWGDPGDSVVEFTHVKQSADIAGPRRMVVHPGGLVEADNGIDLLAVLRLRGEQGITAAEAARVLLSKENPTPNEVERARRKLDRYVRDRVAQCFTGGRGRSADGSTAARWVAVTPAEGEPG
jgi:hypothetical protein